jgi:hypothetical protein
MSIAQESVITSARRQSEIPYRAELPPGVILSFNNAILDRQIAELQERYAEQDDRSEIDNDIASISQELARLFDTLSTTPIVSWNDYFRLFSHSAFLEQRVKIPAAFSVQQEWQERNSLINGVYGINAAIIELALSLHDNSTSESDQMRLRGVIQEQTVSALLNYPQTPSTIALPASMIDDLKHETDIDYWRIQQKVATRVGLQVRSRMPPNSPLTTKSGSIIVMAEDFGNALHGSKLPLETSRLIVADVSEHGLDPAQKQRLEDRQASFTRLVNDRIADSTRS